jgi:hypothetical protein
LTVRSNDTPARAKQIALGDNADGTIGSVTGGSADVDCYKFTATIGDVIRITLAPREGGDYTAFADIVDSMNNTVQQLLPITEDLTTATRQFYVTATGTQFVCVQDLRNLVSAISMEDPTIGGADVKYRFTAVKETVTPTTVTLPVVARAGTLSADQGVQIFQFTATGATPIHAEIRAGRLTPESHVDPRIELVNASGATAVVIASNDDIDFEGMNYDSAIDANLPGAGTYQIVLNPFAVYAPDTGTVNLAFELDVTTGAVDGGTPTDGGTTPDAGAGDGG